MKSNHSQRGSRNRHALHRECDNHKSRFDTLSGRVSLHHWSLILVWLAVVLCGTAPSVQGGTLSPTADSYVWNDNSSTNYGTITTMSSSYNVGNKDNRFVFMKFNLSSIANSFSNVKLRLYGGMDQSSDSFTVYAVSDTTWGETTITYNNYPALGSALQTISITTTTQWWTWSNITSYIQQENLRVPNFLA